MHIAVVVPAFNLAPYLRDCLVSLLDQTHANWFAVIVDDGSTDATGEVAARSCDRRIRLVRQENAGVSAARNTGIRSALGSPADRSGAEGGNADAFLFLDGDDWLSPDALAVLADALEAAPWAVAAYGRYVRVGRDGAMRSAPLPPDGCALERLLTRNLFANGGHLLVRREALEATGEFRVDLAYGEDWDYWARLALTGEFIAVRSRTPVLFVRERSDGAYRSHATDPDAYRPALDAIYRNPGITDRLGAPRLAALRRRANAETAWSIGRELIRNSNPRAGRRWLQYSIRQAPGLKRLLLLALSSFRFGPFRLY